MSSDRLERLYSAYAEGGVAELAPAFEACALDEGVLDPLIEACASEARCVPATWILRQLLERGCELDPARTATLIRSLDRVSDADARLHLCQSMRWLEPSARNAEQLARFLRSGCEGDHKLVRAWSMDGFQHLAGHHPRYVAEARKWLARAAEDPAASVRARARRISDGR
ncbi:MAG: hypothetical protein ACYSWX_07390 [Planctomycetota bacterium]